MDVHARAFDLECFLEEVRREFTRATTKFPSSDGAMTATGEEFGELCKAYLDEPREAVRLEAVQLATMAARVAIEGDALMDSYRKRRNLEPLAK